MVAETRIGLGICCRGSPICQRCVVAAAPRTRGSLRIVTPRTGLSSTNRRSEAEETREMAVHRGRCTAALFQPRSARRFAEQLEAVPWPRGLPVTPSGRAANRVVAVNPDRETGTLRSRLRETAPVKPVTEVAETLTDLRRWCPAILIGSGGVGDSWREARDSCFFA